MATATLADMKWLARWNDPEVLFGDNTKYESDGGEGFDVGRFLILTVACHSFYWLVHFVSKATSTTYNGLKDASGRSTWCAYFASIVHGSTICYWSFPTVFAHWNAVTTMTNFDLMLPGMHKVFYLFSGYTLHDLIIVVAYMDGKPDDYLYVFHHLLTIAVWWYVISVDSFFALGAMMCCVEFTQPFLSLRWLFYEHKMQDSIYYKINALIIFVGWWVLRIFMLVGFMGSIVVAHALTSPSGIASHEVPIVVAWACGAVLQLVWGAKLTMGFLRVVFPGTFKKKKRT